LYCEWRKNTDPTAKWTLRSFESIRQNRQRWINETNFNRNKLGNYYNCEYEPMKIFPSTGNIIDSVPIPELHLLLGVTNKLLNECLNVFPETELWLTRLHLIRERYHSKCLEGNECRRLLKNVSVFEAICEEHSAGESVKKFIAAFKSFAHVVKTMFGHELIDGYAEALDQFKKDYSALGISFTTKVHILLAHAPHVCSERKYGLSYFSEQGVESCHREFRTWWSRHLVKDSTSPSFAKNLLQTVNEYTASHIN